jgi:hypothetical protein
MHTTKAATATPTANQRLRTMSDAHRDHARLACFSCRNRGQSTRGPIPPRIAGNKVSTTAIDTSGIKMPPIPTLRSPGTGSTTSASKPMATVTPETATVRPAVSTARTTACSLVKPQSRSSRQRVTSAQALGVTATRELVQAVIPTS